MSSAVRSAVLHWRAAAWDSQLPEHSFKAPAHLLTTRSRLVALASCIDCDNVTRSRAPAGVNTGRAITMAMRRWPSFSGTLPGWVPMVVRPRAQSSWRIELS